MIRGPGLPPIQAPILMLRGPKGGVTKNSANYTKGVGYLARKKKSTRVDDEKNRLLALFNGLDHNKLEVCQALIDRAAYITVSLQDLEDQLNETGWVEPYQNGENQSGMKKAAAADVHISLTKNLNAITKQLLELVPPAQKRSKLEELMRQ